MAYLYPPAGFTLGDIAVGALGTPVVFGAPTSYSCTLTNGAYAIQAQASGASACTIEVPIPAALAANGTRIRIDGNSWGNTGACVCGTYAKSAAGLISSMQIYGADQTFQTAHYGAGWTGGVATYIQTASRSGSTFIGVAVNGVDFDFQESPDVVEYGICFFVPTGIWGGVRFSTAEAR